MKGSWAVRMAAAMVCLAGAGGGAGAFGAVSSKARVILVTQEKGYVHDVAERVGGRPSVVEWTLERIGEESGEFDVEVVGDVRQLPAKLKGAKAVVFYTTGELPFENDGLGKLEKWVKEGGAILGIHGATDTLRLNGTWHNLIGGTYDGHPWDADDLVTFKVQDPSFPACRAFGETFSLKEEVDQEKNFDPKVVHELISVDMERTEKKRPIHIPVAWCREYEKGKVFYTNLGHNESVWENPAYQRHLLGAMEWLLGIAKGDAKPNPEVSAREDAIIKKLGVPGWGLPAVGEGLTISTFAAAPMFHSPSSGCVSADGRVFVAEDEYNTGDDRKMGICRVKMIADTDGDGKADKVTVFADKLCAPQGMTFVGDTLYVVNAPFLTKFRDTNGDAVADEREDLITGFGPVPQGLVHHIPSGVHMGIDGFLYITVGDKGIVKATGRDGRTIRLMGGGVVRIRPDGTEMEIFNSGNRNPFSPAIDPYMNIFVRDNTNDGGGWNSRLSQMQRGAEYGYPRLFVNFGDEIVPCMADYGGGGATGSVYVKEPGLPRPYGDSLYTIDWGRSFVYRHNLTPAGATFKPDQEEFVFGSFPTSIDVDGRGRLYVVNWGRMSWGAAPPSGSVYRIESEGWNVPAMPVMAKLSDEQLVAEIASSSAVARREAQWEILKRGRKEMGARLMEIAKGEGALDARVAALFTYAQLEGPAGMSGLAELWRDKSLREFAIRAMGDRPNWAGYANAEVYAASMRDENPRVRVQAAIAIGKSGRGDLAKYLIPATADKDVMVRQGAMQALRELNAVDVCVAALENERDAEVVAGVLRTVRGMHDARVVEEMGRFVTEGRPSSLKKDALKTLERLYTVEGEWDGSWWETRPDTRGPNYRPARWAKSAEVGGMFVGLLQDKDPEVAKAAVAAVGLVRAKEAAPALAEIVKVGGPLKVDAVRGLVEMKSDSPEAVAAMESVITGQGWDEGLVNEAVGVLGGMEQPAAQEALVRVVKKLDGEEKVRAGVLARACDALANRAAAGERVGPVAELLAAKNESVRVAAASALVRSNDAGAKARVAKVWAGNEESKVEAMLGALARVPADVAKGQMDHVKGSLKDSRMTVRHAAITAVGRGGDASAVTALLAAAKSWKDREVAAEALAEIDPAKVGKDQIVAATGVLSETAAAMAKGEDKAGYGKVLAAAQKYLADARVPREKAAGWIKDLKQTGVIAEYAKTDPIPVEAGKAFTAVMAPDQHPAGPFGTFAAGGKPVDWKHVVVTDPTGVLGLPMPANTVTYLNTTYDAGTGGAAVLTAGSDDGLHVWLNGKKVIANDANRPTKADQDRALVQLLAGTNVLLLRVNNNAGDAGVQARIRQAVMDFDPAELEQLAKEIPGDAKRGRGVFERVGCVKCHATDPHEEPKGPFLGDAGVKFQRSHVIESILHPSAKIAQGFDTVRITAKADGGGTTEYVGWVTKEGSDEVTMRDGAGQVYELPKSKIVKRETLPQSMMPEGLMRGVTLEDFSSLMAYIGSLNVKP